MRLKLSLLFLTVILLVQVWCEPNRKGSPAVSGFGGNSPDLKEASMVRIKNFLKNLFTVKWLGRIAILGWIIFGISHYCGITASPVSVAPGGVFQTAAPQHTP